ncbi:MAG: type II toxin-antitoxin system VapC family toxin [Gemmatimonadota bacterium]
MIVVDASAIVEVLLQLTAAESLMGRLFDSGETLHGPQLLDVEVTQVVRRYWLRGELTAIRAGEAIQDLADLPVTRYAHDSLLTRIWQLRNNLTAYDAAYVALAEALGAPLITRDASLGKVRGIRAQVEVF